MIEYHLKSLKMELHCITIKPPILGEELWKVKLVRQSQIVQSVMQDYQYDLSHLLPVCNLLVQGPKITYN